MVEHNEKEMYFFVKVENVEAKLLYRKVSDDVIDIYSTFVPPEARGKGLAKVLTEAGVEFAKSKDFKIKPSCSYVDAYFRKHPELKDLEA